MGYMPFIFMKGHNLKIVSIPYLLAIVFGLAACRAAYGNPPAFTEVVTKTPVIIRSLTITSSMEPSNTLTQEILLYFTRASSDKLPLQSWQKTPISAQVQTRVAEEDKKWNASLTISEVEKQAGFNVLEPAWLPDALTFNRVNYDSKYKFAHLFYDLIDHGIVIPGNGLVIKEQLVPIIDDCVELCGVGATAVIEKVQIGDVTGEYVVGGWNLTDSGPVWDPNPYQQNMRWHANGMAFEFFCFCPIGDVTKADLIKIAKSMK
jgi:hypothetical protein